MRRFFINVPLSSTVFIEGADARHMALVLRMASGDTVQVAAPDGKTAKAEIIRISAESVQLTLLEAMEDHTEPPVKVWLVQGLGKGEKMDYIIQKAVELGVYGIIPAITEHCIVKYDVQKQADKVVRWQKIAREAAKQCGRSYIPRILPVTRLAAVLGQPEISNASTIMLYEGQAPQGLKQVLSKTGRPVYGLFIGPEGGFSPAEVALCAANGVSVVSMGPRIMRTETAAVAALTVVMYECGDLGG
ncbi:16S rRNA (uracil(1498)-N(3))-methyltransferase [Sporomusa termitida]|uniref:Ribosomal RNA small subunit methyltransferase E n=1 Tax=Sporomusa termitida TaxID=2377 RepID=A0A517DUC6_9FIRM|nr:16S rRNA (uracil(1498)-N(3))-methyltransferase [Sporomusa termitida]QDR80947.1 Ribosomal RNA small subunit methyltransferase E [Sporomusa termitida]